MLYEETRGTDHTIMTELLPKGPIPMLPPPPSDAINKFTNKLKIYIQTIINLTNEFLLVLQNLKTARINKINMLYFGESIY